MLLDCTKCDGRCCKTPINNFNVVLLPQEMKNLKKFSKKLKTRYGGVYILNKKEDGSCIFLDNMHRCTIYKDRPFECKVFPLVIDYERTFVLSKLCPKIKNITKKEICNSIKEWKNKQLSTNWIKAYSTIPIN